MTRMTGERTGGVERQRSQAMRLVMFNEVAETAPVTLGQQSQVFLNNPNARAAYTLKSYAIRQLNFMREDTLKGVGKMGLKHDAKAAAKLAKYAMYMGTGNYGINEVRNALWTLNADPMEFDLEGLGMDMVWSVIGTQGVLNAYNVQYDLARGDLVGAVAGAVIPSLGIVGAASNEAYQLLRSAWNDDTYEFDSWALINTIPGGVGEQLELIFGDKRERLQDAADKRARESGSGGGGSF